MSKRPSSLLDALPGLGRTLRTLSPYLGRHTSLTLGSSAALLAEVGLRLLEPWPLKFVFDAIVLEATGRQPAAGGHDTTTLIVLCASALVLIAGLRACAAYACTIGFAQIGNRVLSAVRSDLYRHLQRLSLRFHSKARGGDLVVRMISDVGMLKEVAVTALLPLLGNALVLIGMLCVMLVLEWRLVVLVALVFPLLGLRSRSLGRRIQETSRLQRKREGAMAATAAEAIGSIRAVQALALETAFGSAFASENTKSRKDDVKAKRLAANLERSFDVLIALATALVLAGGARAVIAGTMTPGDLLVFLTYLKIAFRPMRNLAKYTSRLAKASAAGERIVDLLEESPDIADRPDAIRARSLRNPIRFDRVTFAYEPGHPVLHDVSFEIRPGQWVAVVGPSGSGKSTLASLLLRLYDPTEGSVRVAGHDIRDFRIKSLRKKMSVVLQDDLLFGLSVYDNIALGAPDASRGEVMRAARLARAHDFIVGLPDGYRTVLGERGVTLSGGQRRRIAIARAAIRRAPLLILDEPTSGLDDENAAEMAKALTDLAAHATTLLITHDLTLAAQSDTVLYLEGGRLLEAGPHHLLLQRRGRYAELFRNRSPQLGLRPAAATGA